MRDYQKDLFELLRIVIKEEASDLHFSVSKYPMMRVAGILIPLVNKPILSPEDTQGLIFAMMSEEVKELLRRDREVDFSYMFEDRTRFRINAFYQRGFLSAALRLIPSKIRNFEELNLPPMLADFANKEQGFFLVVGPIGHGKSTTLAAMIDYINHIKAEHILTVEDPVEYLFVQDKSIIDQREVRFDTKDFNTALRSMFRQDVNAAMIGEMRDTETMSVAVTAAETGHLIFSSLHTNSAAQTIDRIIDSFLASQQNQIRLQLSSALIGIFSQRLIPRISGGLIPAYELLINTSAVKTLIRENRTHEIDMMIENSYELGMVSLNRSLTELVRRGEISMENAYGYSLNPKGLEGML